MSYAEWFGRQVESSTESLAWGLGMIPAARRVEKPPAKLGEWTAARLLFHILYYESEVALPAVRLWTGGEYPSFEGYDEAAAWGNGHEPEKVLEELRETRRRIISVLQEVLDPDWDSVKLTPWGDKSLYWVASKTYQHGIEHLSGILRAAMLWDHYASRKATTHIE